MADEKTIDAEVKLLACMAYGEGSAANDRDEIFALASVLVRQRNARGYSTMSAFIKGEPSYSYVIGDGNPRYNKMSKASDAGIRKDSGMSLAIEAAENAMKGGPDLSNGAYFWDGGDIKINYAKHFKVRHGVKFTDPAHNVYDIKESTKLVILTRTVKKRIGKKVTTTKEEIGRYDHVYESTAGHGGTIFWKNGSDYLSTAGAKEYK